MYEAVVIGRYLMKVKYLIKQNRKLKSMSCYMETYKNGSKKKFLRRTKFIKFVSHRGVSRAVFKSTDWMGIQKSIPKKYHVETFLPGMTKF